LVARIKLRDKQQMIPGSPGGNRNRRKIFYLPHPLSPSLLTRCQRRGGGIERGADASLRHLVGADDDKTTGEAADDIGQLEWD